jgi:cytochrome c-type biogenesis protein
MVELLITFIIGVISFVSPCVLPLVPAYLGYMSSRVTSTVSAQIEISGGTGTIRTRQARYSTFLHGVAFVSGFTLVFVSIGVLSSLLIQLGGVHTVSGLLARIGGVVIIFFGLHFMGVLPSLFNVLRQYPALMNAALSAAVLAALTVLLLWGFTGTITPWSIEPAALIEPEPWTITVAYALSLLAAVSMILAGAFHQPRVFWTKLLNTLEAVLYTDTRRSMMAEGQHGLTGSMFMGVVFAAGWTPCIGPTLGTAMTLAAGASASEVGWGGVLLAAYSLGLGIPFLLAALTLDGAQGFLRRLGPYMRYIQLVSGVFLMVIGVTVATGELQSLSAQLSVELADFSLRLEACVTDTLEGEIAVVDTLDCIRGVRWIDDLTGTALEPVLDPDAVADRSL